MTARRLARECARRAVASTTAATARTTTAATTTATRCVQTSSLARFAAPVRAFSPNAKPRSLETAATKDARRRSRALAHRLAAGGADAGWIF